MCESNIIFYFSLLNGESVGICDSVPSIVQSSCFCYCAFLNIAICAKINNADFDQTLYLELL